jgi:hypothetical protein
MHLMRAAEVAVEKRAAAIAAADHNLKLFTSRSKIEEFLSK